jgi:tagatose 6-phosphate kinase
MGFVGGETGLMIERLMHEEGVPFDFVRVAGMSREGVTYREADGTATSIFEPPHQVSEEEVNRLLEKASLLVPRSSWLVCAGSSPCPSADGLFCDILEMCRKRKVPAVLDSYGVAFSTALESMPTLVKPNKHECESSLGRQLDGPEAMADLAAELVRQGLTYAVITDGPHTFAAADRSRRWIVKPPQITAVNPIGSGDSMVAAMVTGLSRGWPFEQCLAFGAAAGAVNARVWPGTWRSGSYEAT